MSATDPLTRVPVLHFIGGQTVVEWRDYATIDHKVAHLVSLAEGNEGARDPMVRAIAADIRRRSPSPLERLRAAHDYRARAICYVPEGEEILETPRNVLSDGYRYADCEGHMALGIALAIALGGRAWPLLMGGTREDPEHASLIVTDDPRAPFPPDGRPIWRPLAELAPAPSRWFYSDTSVQSRTPVLVGGHAHYRVAAFGEHPYAAAMRLDTLKDPRAAF